MTEIITIIVAVIALLLIILAYVVGSRRGAERKEQEWRTTLPLQRKEAIAKSRAILSGQFAEQLAPFLPDFAYAPTECKFLGKPIDFLVFKGMDEKNISKVIFVEVKSGKSKLSVSEKSLKEAIEQKQVFWEEYRIPERLTKKQIEENDNNTN